MRRTFAPGRWGPYLANWQAWRNKIRRLRSPGWRITGTCRGFSDRRYPVLVANSFLLLACYLHNHALRAYRGRVGVYREQGTNFQDAQRLALRASAQS